MNLKRMTMALGLALLAGVAGSADAQLIQTQTYQGRLEVSGSPAQGVHQIRLRVFDAAAGGVQLAQEIRTKNFSSSDNGLFTFNDLVFGDIFGTGADRWIEISARAGTSDPFVVLGPRQPITAAPVADVANQLALPYSDSANVGLSSAAFRIGNTNPNGWSIFARSGPDSGVSWNTATAVFDSADTGPLFGLISAGAQSGVVAAGYHPGSYGLQAERYFGNDTGAAVFVFDLADGNDVRLGTASYAGDFFGDVRFQDGVDILGEEIDRTEILDEPGVASLAGSSMNASTVGYSSIVSRSITAPTAGYVIVIGGAEVEHDHFNGTISRVEYGVSNSSSSVTGSARFSRIDDAAPSGFYSLCASDQHVFPVSAGTHTYHLVAYQSSGTGATLFNPQVTLIFVPTAYGTVAATDGGGDDLVRAGLAAARGPLTPAEILAERAIEEDRAMDEMIRRQAEIDRLVAEQRAALKALSQPGVRQ